MNILEAALTVMQQTGTPMKVEAITNEMLRQGLWDTKGKTPAATVGARIYMDIKENGNSSAFVKVQRGLFALNGSNTVSPAVDTPRRSKKLPPKPKAGETFSFLDCAEKVLRFANNRKPMHYKTITQKALEFGWLATNGQTPEASMGAQLYMDIKKCHAQGRMSRFIMNKGLVSLSEWSASGLEAKIEAYNAIQRKKLLERVYALSPADFERLISELLIRMGFESVAPTSYTKDHGVDVRGTLTVHESIRIKLAVQAKRWQNNVDSTVVQNLRGSVDTDERGLIVTTSDFSKGAREEAAKPTKHAPIDLINGDQLVSLLIEHDMGVRRNQYQMIELQETFFVEDDE